MADNPEVNIYFGADNSKAKAVIKDTEVTVKKAAASMEREALKMTKAFNPSWRKVINSPQGDFLKVKGIDEVNNQLLTTTARIKDASLKGKALLNPKNLDVFRSELTQIVKKTKEYNTLAGAKIKARELLDPDQLALANQYFSQYKKKYGEQISQENLWRQAVTKSGQIYNAIKADEMSKEKESLALQKAVDKYRLQVGNGAKVFTARAEGRRIQRQNPSLSPVEAFKQAVTKITVDDSALKKAANEAAKLKAKLAEIRLVYGKQMASDVNKLANELLRAGKAANKLQAIGMAMKKIQKDMKPTQFQGYALTIMLFGMQLKATLDNIWKTSSRTFQDVMHSVEGAVTGFDNLNASMAYLGFAVGMALEPIAAFLAPIIWAVADWLATNEGLQAWVRTIFVIASILAIVFIILGQGILFIAGAIDGWKKLGEAMKWIADGKLLKFFKDIGKSLTSMWGSLVKTVTQVWSWAFGSWAAAGATLVLIGLVLALIAVGMTFGMAWEQILKGWKLKFQWIWSFVEEFFLWMAHQLAKLGIIFANFGLNIKLAWIAVWDGIKVAFANVFNWIIGKGQRILQNLIDGLGKFAPQWMIDLQDTFANLKINPNDLKTQIDPADQKALEEQMKALKDLDTAYADMHHDILMKRWELEKEMAAIEAEGWQRIKDGWASVFAYITGGGVGGANGANAPIPNIPTLTPGETVGGSTNYIGGDDNSVTNIQIDITQREGESQDDFMQRLLDELNRRKTTV